ncbi:MAG: hypothetical protein V3T11_10695 [Roseateles sp.]
MERPEGTHVCQGRGGRFSAPDLAALRFGRSGRIQLAQSLCRHGDAAPARPARQERDVRGGRSGPLVKKAIAACEVQATTPWMGTASSTVMVRDGSAAIVQQLAQTLHLVFAGLLRS